MILPQPELGMVIRYSSLWANESSGGREEGSKDRPCAIVMTTRDVGGKMLIQVLPITHSQPTETAGAVKIPALVKQHLKLDDDRSWVLLSEYNEFIWPGYGLRPIGKTDSPLHGYLPPDFFRYVASRFAARQGRIAVKRT